MIVLDCNVADAVAAADEENEDTVRCFLLLVRVNVVAVGDVVAAVAGQCS